MQGTSSNTLHVRSGDHDAVVRAYTALMKRRGFRLRAPGGLPQYLESVDEPDFRRVLVGPVQNGWVTVIDQAFDAQDARVINGICRSITTAMHCAGLAFIVHQSDVFYYYLWLDGAMKDRYCSWPGWYSEDGTAPRIASRWKGKASALLPYCVAGTRAADLKDVLLDYSRCGDHPLDPPVYAELILRDLADLLGIQDPVRTYHDYHARRAGLFMAVPGETGARSRLRIDREPEPRDPYWEGFTHLEFFRR